MNNISITYKAIIVAALGGIIAASGVTVVPSQEELDTFVKVGGIIIAAGVALYGRWRAGGINAFGQRVGKYGRGSSGT
jgi:hypothetical protein